MVKLTQHDKKSWLFFLEASGEDIKTVCEVMSHYFKGVRCNYQPIMVISALFDTRYNGQESISYEKYIKDIYKDLGLKSDSTQPSLFEKENSILLNALTHSIKHLSNKELEVFKQKAGLTNSSRDSIIREIVAKTSSSVQFKRLLPALTSVVLGVGIPAASATALGLGISAISLLGGPIGVLGSVLALQTLMASNKKKKSANQVLAVTSVLIRIRREYILTFLDSQEALSYIRTVIHTSNCRDKGRVASTLLVALLKEDEEYTNTQAVEEASRKTGLFAGDIIPQRKIEVLRPYYQESEDFLCSYIQDNGDSLSILPILYPKHEQHAKRVLNTTELTHNYITSHPLSESEIARIEELERRVTRIERILHGIRHNLAPDFSNALNPYREFLLDPSIPISIEEAREANEIGTMIISCLEKAGKEDYGEEEIVDLTESIKNEFSDEQYTVTFQDVPDQALVNFNKLSLHTQVFNNVRKNISQHAFGMYSEATVSREFKKVQISIVDYDEYWTIVIKNNGEPFPKEANVDEIWEYGRSFGHQSSLNGGTGMFYIKDCVEHFGGKVAFATIDKGDFTVEYRIMLKKHINNGV